MKVSKMFPISLSLGIFGVGFLASAGLTVPPHSLPFRWRNAVSERGHFSPVLAKVTWRNGDSRTLAFEGVGCEVSMCSRVRIQSRVKGSTVVNDTWLDSINSIKDITSQDALFTFKDGTTRRLPVISGNRFLYFGNGNIEMGKFESVEFVAR